MEKLTGTIFYAPHPYISYIEKERGRSARRYGPFVMDFEKQGTSVWARDEWQEIIKIPYKHAKQAASALLEIAPQWECLPWTHKEFASEIEDNLRKQSQKPINFENKVPKWFGKPQPRFTVFDDKYLLASTKVKNPFPYAEALFTQHKKGPPSSAYLKLFEGLFRLGCIPQAEERALDLGASPGGWTWVLASQGAKVIAVDRVSIDPKLLSNEKIEFVQGNAFTYKTDEKLDFITSDIICYPDALWNWYQEFYKLHPEANYILTIKMQEKADYSIIEKFLGLANAEVFHGTHNKHELTVIIKKG